MRWNGGRVMGMALAMACAGARAAMLSPAPSAVLDLGEVGVGGQSLVTVSFTNAGVRGFAVTNIVSSCECLQILSYRRAMPPGATNSVRLRLKPDRAGTVTYRIEAGFTEGAPVWACALTARAKAGQAVPPALPGAETIAPDLLLTVLRDPETRWYVGPAECLADGRLRPGVTVVDVRATESFEACRIPDALHMPLHLVKTKPFLQSRDVVLVGEGPGSERLENECRRLAGSGFRSVRLLRGGMDLWRRQGGPVTGWQAGEGGLSELSAAVFMESRDSSEWLIVDAGDGEAEGDYLLPPHVKLPFAARPAAFASELAQQVRQQGGTRTVVIVDRDGAYRQPLGVVLQGLRDVGVFYLEGGLAGLCLHLNQLTQMRGSTRMATRTQVQGVTAPRKPCGGCP
jgi:rhodanese-related sulfurtransferase